MRFVSGDQTLNSVAAFLSSENTEIALAVAFWGGDALKRLRVAEWKAKKVRVICDALSGACNPQALKDLRKQVGADLRTNNRLHAKVYWTPSKLIVTSANASASGLALQDREVEGNIEAGIESTSPELLIAAKNWFDAVFNSTETVEVNDTVIAQAEQMWRTRPHGPRSVKQIDSISAATFPAQLLAPVEQHWITQALKEFRTRKMEKMYFGTDSPQISINNHPPVIETVLFKPAGNTYVTTKANFIGITDKSPPEHERLEGKVTKTYHIYYGFNNPEELPEPISLSSLRRYASGKVVRNDVPGCCFVSFITDEAR